MIEGDDKILVEAIQNGDEKAFEKIFRKYFQTLKDYAIFYTEEARLAEDMVQDLFLSIWSSRSRLKIHTHLKGYLIRSVHNSCIQYLRHQSVEQRYLKNQKLKLEEALLINGLFFEKGLSALYEKDIHSLLDKATQKLSPKTRKIFFLNRFEHMSNKEIAEKLNLSEKAIEYHLTKSLKILKESLKDYL